MSDSENANLDHIRRVRTLLNAIAHDLIQRGLEHDHSKLQEPERSGFKQMAEELKLAETEYGSDEYRAILKKYQPIIQHHYDANDHHPEHFTGGIEEMDLVQLIEMLCDWKAASERMAGGGNMYRSIDINRERFGISDQLTQILLNTVATYGWHPDPEPGEPDGTPGVDPAGDGSGDDHADRPLSAPEPDPDAARALRQHSLAEIGRKRQRSASSS